MATLEEQISELRDLIEAQNKKIDELTRGQHLNIGRIYEALDQIAELREGQ